MVLARLALGNAKVIGFVVLVLAILGVHAYLVAPQSIFPTMSFSRIDVVAEVGDLPPDQVRVAVTAPLEAAFETLPSVQFVDATSSQGSAELLVNFASSTDPQIDLQYVDQAISQIRSTLASATSVVAVIVNPNSEPVLSYALRSRDLSQAVLRQIATYQIVPKLYGTPGLGRLLVTGGPQAEYHVALDPAKIAQLGLGAGDVSKALGDANGVRAVGLMQRYYQSFAILVDASLTDRASLAAVAVPTKNGGAVPLGSVAKISLGVAPMTDQTSLDGTHAVFLNAYALPGADTVKMADAVRAGLATLVPHLPGDVAIDLFWDQTTLIVASQSALRDAILLGALLAIVVIYVFLRNVRLTLVAAAIIPLAMSIAVFALELAGQTLNLMSVGGLAVAVGLIIDDAIVVVENIERNRDAHPELDARENVTRAMTQLGGAMTASTLATVVVFLPLGLLSGVAGFFFRSLAFTLSASLVVSLGLALLLAPNVARALLSAGPSRGERGRDPFPFIVARYERVLKWALDHRTLIAIGATGTLLVTLLLLARLPSDFLPKMDEGQFEIGYTMPVGTTLAASDAAATRMEDVVARDPAVEHVGRLTGIDSNGFSPTPANVGLLRVRLKAQGLRDPYDIVSARLRDALQAQDPAALFDFRQILEDLIDGLSGTPAPIEISIFGTDEPTLVKIATDLSAKLADLPGIVDASSGVTYDSPSLRVAPKGGALALLGLTTADVGDALAALGTGDVATSVQHANALVPVRVTVADSPSAADLLSGNASLFARGTSTSLGDLAVVTATRLASDLSTRNGRLLIRVTGNISGANLSAVTNEIRALLATTPLPSGYSAEIGGQAQTQARSFSEFVSAIAIAIALVFAVMLATFKSFRLPLVVLAAIPLALIGVAAGLALTGTPFNVSSFMGLLLLVGVVVKNGILLVDVANVRRRAGATVHDALVEAGKTRVRPIVMTTLAAIGGLLPLAIGIGQGAEMEKPLAVAVIGGLSTATLFTLILIPVLYAAFADRSVPE